MVFKRIGGWLERTLGAVWNAAEQYWTQWTKPDSDSLLVGSVANLTRSSAELSWGIRFDLRRRLYRLPPKNCRGRVI